MSKILKKLRKDKGYVFENDNVKIETKYSDDAVEKELISFTQKTDTPIVFSAGEMLDMIREQFRQHNLAGALTTTDTSFVPSVETAINITFNANKDIAKGELVQFFAPFHMPLGIALVMEAHKLCSIKGKEVSKVPIEEFEEAKITLAESNKEFVEKFFKPQIENLKKIRGETNSEATSEETKEINNN